MERRKAGELVVVLIIGLTVGVISPLSIADSPEPSKQVYSENVRHTLMTQGGTKVTKVRQTINATIPADDTNNLDKINISLEVTRNLSANPMLDYSANDPILFQYNYRDIGPGYALLVDLAGPTVYGPSRNAGKQIPVSANKWRPLIAFSSVAQRTRSVNNSVDTIARIGNRKFVAFSDGIIYRLFGSAETEIDFPEDPGIYYDGKKYHMYYESGNTSGFSGTKIGHATSPNGITSWTEHEPVYTMKGEYQSGDYAIVEENGVYFLFGDYTTNHPEYNVSVWVNDDLNSSFTRLGTVLSTTKNERGIQDLTVKYDEARGQYVFMAQVHKRSGDELHYAVGEIRVNKSVSEN